MLYKLAGLLYELALKTIKFPFRVESDIRYQF